MEKSNYNSETSNFGEKVQKEKEIRSENLSDLLIKQKLGKEDFVDIKKFFHKNGIELESVRKFLYKKLDGKITDKNKKNLIESVITNLSLNEGKTEIINDILQKGPFNSEKELTQTIADYIKSKIGYDGINSVFLIKILLLNKGISLEEAKVDSIFTILANSGVVLNKKIKKEIEKSQREGNLENYIYLLFSNQIKDKEGVIFTGYHLKLFDSIIKKIKERVDLEDIPKNIISYINQIQAFIENNDIEGFKNYFLTKFGEEKSFRNFLFKGIIGELGAIELLQSGNITEIREVLEKTHIGVCRHFSVIMKKIYNEIIKNGEGVNFKGESEMLYVANFKDYHAYNILLSEGENGEIKKQYLDMTSFITGGELFKETNKEKVEKRKKTEFWVQNNTNNNFEDKQYS